MKNGRIQRTMMNLKKMIAIFVLLCVLIIGSAIGALVLMRLQHWGLTIWIIVTGILDVVVTSCLLRVRKGIKNLKMAIDNMNKVLDMYFEAMKNGNEDK